MSEFKTLYEKAASAIGCKQSVFRKEFRRLVKAKKQEEQEQQMENDDRAQTEQLRAAMADTPFGKYLAGKLAKSKVGAE